MDQIADLLTRIRNATLVRKNEITVSFSKMKEAVLKIFAEQGFLSSVSVETIEDKKYLKLVVSDKKVPSHLKQISKPGRRIYIKSKEMPKPLRGLGVVIISTSTGVITGKEAAKKGLGGELICEIW